MTRRTTLLSVLFIFPLFCGSAYGQGPLNFYLPDTLPDTAEARPAKKPEAEAKPKAKSEIESSRSADKPEPPKTESAKKTAAPAPVEPKPRAERPRIADVIKSSAPSRNIDPPLDPFGLAAAFQDRWDFSSFVISAREELRFRLNAVRARTQNLSRAFSALSDEVAVRQRNLNSAALAIYLLGRDQESWLPLEGRNLTEAQHLAVKTTMLQDVSAMRNALRDYDTLRNSLNDSAEELAALEKQGLDALPAPVNPNDAVTVPTATLAHQKMDSILGERIVDLATLKASLATEMLRESAHHRQVIASFAPPPPGVSGTLPGGGSATMPVPSEEVMKNQPRGATLSQPERSSTIIVETKINAPITTVKEGVVVYAGPFRGYGNMVIVEHQKGLFSIYTHLGNIQVLERQPVKAGDALGRAGTLPEAGKNGIHFQVRKGKDQLKPEDWLGTREVAGLIAK